MNPTTPKAQSLAFIQVGATGIVRTLMGVQFRIRHPVRPGSRSDKLATGRRPRSCARDIMPGLSLLLALSIPTGHAGANLDAKRVKEIAGWLPSQPAGVGQAITNRPAWEELARQAAFAPVVPAAERLAKEESFYRDLHPGYRNHFDRLGEPEGTVGVAAADAEDAQAQLAAYTALDTIVVRGLASAKVEAVTAVAAAAAP